MSDTPSSQQSQRDAKIVDRHLPEGYSAEADAISSSSNSATPNDKGESNEEASSLLLQGGDVHRDIFKIKARANAPRRSQTFSAPSIARTTSHHRSEVDAEAEQPRQDQPGAFRRQFVQRQSLRRRVTNVTAPVTRDFVSFLELYGSFAGENLADTDDEDATTNNDDDEDEERAAGHDEHGAERRPLLGRRKSTKQTAKQGDAGTVRTFFTLIKAFVGTGIMFLPKAFKNGGIVFSSIVLVVVSLVTAICFRLLLQCRQKHGGGGYGELGNIIVSEWFRTIILASIALSQLGFVCAGIIFTAENLEAFLSAVYQGNHSPLSTESLILLQFVVLIPLSLIRNISKLGPAALLADVFILIGLVYIWQYDIGSLARHGIDSSVRLFNPGAFTLTIGSAIFTFEGIGLILPIQSSMKSPEKFGPLLYLVMIIITLIFSSVGILCYATFGESTNIQVISNFPQDSKLVNVVQFVYSLAVLAGAPVQLFPAVRILETSLFGENATGRKSVAMKWKKNALRTTAVCFCGAVAILGASDLDKFVALIGSVACVPLVYIYPPFLHWRGVAETRVEKSLDIAMMVLGAVSMIYTTAVTISQWIQG